MSQHTRDNLKEIPVVNEVHSSPAVETAGREFADAFNRGDLAGVAAIFAEDAVMLPPGSETIVGRSNIQAYWGGRRGLADVRLEPMSVKPLGEAVREAGTMKIGARGPGRRVREVSWNYVFIWQKIGDEWKLETCIWNRRDAVPQAGANQQRGRIGQGAQGAQGGQGGQGGQGRIRRGQGGGQGGQGGAQGGGQGFGQGGAQGAGQGFGQGGQGRMGGGQGRQGGPRGQGGPGGAGGGQGRGGRAPFVPRVD